MTEDLARWLEAQGWDIVSEDPLEARRERVERVEILTAGQDGRFRYTLTLPITEEDFRRVLVENGVLRVVSRSYRETTVIGTATGGSMIATVEAAIRAARS